MTTALARTAGRHARPRRSSTLRWYRLPLPLAALFVVAMPWVAVRDVRRSHTAFRQICDILVIAARQRDQLAGRDQEGAAAAAPKQRHLRLVT